MQSDAGAVQALLRRGGVREAAERYAGPLLPGSDAPGVCRERDALDGWVRHAVMTRQRPRGAVGVGRLARRATTTALAWKLALARMEFHDPRRSQAVAQLARAQSRPARPR